MYPTTTKLSPHASGVLTPQGIVLHHSGGSYAGGVAWIMNPASKVSYHCIVNHNGERTVMVKDNQRAWHAGVSSFKGRSHCNHFMLGIAVSGDTNSRQLTQDEINSVAEWCVSKMLLYGFGLDMITDHKTVSPGRKNDISNEAFKQITDAIQQRLMTAAR